jgi:hypothetical protein
MLSDYLKKTAFDHRRHSLPCTLGCAVPRYAAELALYRQRRRTLWSTCRRSSAVWFVCNGIFCDRILETNQKTKTSALGPFHSSSRGNSRRIGVEVLTRPLNAC